MAVLVCWAYILGLIAAARPWGIGVVLLLGLTATLLRRRWHRLPMPKAWWLGPTASWWAIATGIALITALTLPLRQPQPGPLDISQLQLNQTVAVEGTISQRPRQTRSGSTQLWLQVRQITEPNTTATGKLYVTLPAQQATDLQPSQTVTVKGRLYRPSPVTRPQGYDFAAALAKEGAFAGLRAESVQILRPAAPWGWWRVRDRIRTALEAGTNDTLGPLLGGLVLGKNAVDLPYGLRDNFTQVGLAHALAASGFQVSLILGTVLALGRRWPVSRQIALGSGALLLFGTLSGAEPSIIRAILMGFASLIGLGLERQTRPLMVLLAIATGMLVVNPAWLWDLGFQLSILATLGLLVTVPPLTAQLDWLPPTLATLTAVPLAATLWTLPLQLYAFGVFPLYSIAVNTVTALLLSVLTLGGFVCSIFALLWPGLGSFGASLLYWPLQLLVWLVNWVCTLPGNSLALGTLASWQLLALYGCLLACCVPRWRRYWFALFLIALLIVLIPFWQIQSQRVQITVFDRTYLPMLVLEHPQSTVVINSGDRPTAGQLLVPFLQRAGVNRVDLAISTEQRYHRQSGWATLLNHVDVANLSETVPKTLPFRLSPAPQRRLTLNAQEQISVGAVQATLRRSQPTLLELNLEGDRWLLAAGRSGSDFAAWLAASSLEPVRVLWWTGGELPVSVIDQLQPQTLILSGRGWTEQAIAQLPVPQVFWLQRDGTVQWSPQRGFQTTVNPAEDTLAPL